MQILNPLKLRIMVRVRSASASRAARHLRTSRRAIQR